MTIKIKNKQLFESVDALQALSQLMNGIEAANIQKLARQLRKIMAEVEDLMTARNALIKKFWKTDEDGERLPDFKATDEDAFESEMKSLMDTEIEIQITPIDISILGAKPKLTVGQHMALDWWIVQPETAEAE